jgi:hypothetical protein
LRLCSTLLVKQFDEAEVAEDEKELITLTIYQNIRGFDISVDVLKLVKLQVTE